MEEETSVPRIRRFAVKQRQTSGSAALPWSATLKSHIQNPLQHQLTSRMREFQVNLFSCLFAFCFERGLSWQLDVNRVLHGQGEVLYIHTLNPHMLQPSSLRDFALENGCAQSWTEMSTGSGSCNYIVTGTGMLREGGTRWACNEFPRIHWIYKC